MSGSNSEGAETRLERELAYYRREVNDLGAKVIRLQEEQQRSFLDAHRSRLVARMIRELYRIGDLNVSGTPLSERMLAIIVENTMCACAVVLRESQPGTGIFAPVNAVGLPQDFVRTPSMRLRRAPTFMIVTEAAQPEPAASEIVTFLGLPYVLWAYDPVSGYALVLGNRSEANVSRPFEIADQEMIETALTLFLDAQARTLKSVASVENDADSDDDSGRPGLEVAEIVKRRLQQNNQIIAILVIERRSSGSYEYVPYFKVTWRRGWHVLRVYRDRSDRAFRRLNSLFQMLRSELDFHGPVTVYPADSLELNRFLTVSARERSHTRSDQDHSTK